MNIFRLARNGSEFFFKCLPANLNFTSLLVDDDTWQFAMNNHDAFARINKVSFNYSCKFMTKYQQDSDIHI